MLRNYPELNQEDLEAAWTYYADNKAEIEQIIEADNSKSLEVFDECYQNARKIIIKRTGLSPKIFPTEAIASVEQALDEDWLPNINL